MSFIDTVQISSVVRPGATLYTSKGPIRPLSENDLAQIAELYQRVLGETVQSSPAFLKQVLFEPPWRDESLPSVVYEDEGGRIIGCLGRMLRLMKFRGRVVRVAVGHHLIVEASRKGALAGVELRRHFLRGPQDLALAGGDDFSRRVWEFLGGSVSLLYSLCWTRVMRPAQYGLTFLNQHGLPQTASQIFNPVCRVVDAALDLIPQRAFRFRPPAALADELDTVTLLACLSAFDNHRSLQPIYDESSLAWLIKLLDGKRHRGTLHKVVVRTHSGRALGWYLYYLGATGLAEVLQVGGKEDTLRDVLDHLFYHAWQRDAVAVTGPMDPRHCGALSDHCTFHRPDNCWLLIHSQDQRIVNAIHAGDAFLSRLEAEWWIAA